MRNKTVSLFDMDGTLTPVRKRMNDDMVDAINRLTEHCKVGIVTGSKYSYVVEQVPQLFNGKLNSERIDIMPCNGTKRYVFDGQSYKITSDIDMLKKVSRKSYDQIIYDCTSYQLEIMSNYDIPFTGTFIQYRGSLLNWCPIGRDAGEDERAAFVKIDKSQGLRMKYKNLIQTVAAVQGMDIQVALGGSTSLDIYPNGWDKTYGLQHYEDYKFHYFTGDKCQPGGNDWHLYERLKKEGRAYETSSTSRTIEIIKDIISRVSKS